MRYSKEESTNILGVFNSGDTVVVDVIRLSDDTTVVSSASCTEIGTTGIFKYQFSQTVTQKEEYLWAMSNGSFTRYGKIVFGGWMDDVKEKVDTNLDVQVSTRSSHTPADVDTQLSGSHGSGSWQGTTPSDIWAYSSRTLTSLSGQPVVDIDNQLSSSHGNGSWEGQSVSAIADAVWDEVASGHTTTGTFGEMIRLILYMTEYNQQKTFEYNTDQTVSKVTVKFSDDSDPNFQNPVKTFEITFTYNEDKTVATMTVKEV